MTSKPIIFSGPMVRALLREIEQPGTGKTQTRRTLKPQPPNHTDRFYRTPFSAVDGGRWVACTEIGMGLKNYGTRGPRRLIPVEGDLLWVREAWRCLDGLDPLSGLQIAHQCVEEAGYARPWAPIQYEADGARKNWIADPHLFGIDPGRYRHARFMPRWASRLTLEVTDVRVQRVQDISEEDAGAEGTPEGFGGGDIVEDFACFWNSIHGPFAWSRNDWVAAATFRPHLGRDAGGTA